VGVNAETVLRRDGFVVIAPAPTLASDFDAQGHLNNAAIVRLFNDLRVDYVQRRVGREWSDLLADQHLTVAARELHVSYESEGLPGESFVGAMRYPRREGKAAVIEQRLVERDSARAIARAWVVQLLVRDGTVVEWPDSYFDRVAEIEGRVIERPPRPERPFGPGE
jgi:acyl-CoA thioesterase FadM